MRSSNCYRGVVRYELGQRLSGAPVIWKFRRVMEGKTAVALSPPGPAFLFFKWQHGDRNMNAMPVEVPEDRLLKERDAARFLGVSRSFLANSRCLGTRETGQDAPPFIRIGRGGIRYSLADLRAWVDAHRERPRPFPNTGAA